MANVNHPHDHDVPVVEPNQHDDVPIFPEPVLEDEDEDPEENEFKEEEDPQEEDDLEIDIEEDENKPELTYPYEEVDPLNPPPPASESKPNDEIEVENPIEHEDEIVPVSVYEHALVEKKGEAKDKFYGKLILDLGNEVRSIVEQGTATMEKLGNVEEKDECKKLKKELEEARLSNTFLQYHPKLAPMTQAAIRRMIKESVHAVIAAERASAILLPFVGLKELLNCEGPALTWWKTNVATMGLETVNQMPWTEMKQLMTDEFCPIEEIQHMEHELWNLSVKEYDIVAYTQR
ncbi:hypothetical protein Tco_1518861 [Tanacetum coccineum]